MKSMSKFVAVALCCLVLSSMVGCGGGTTTIDKPGSSGKTLEVLLVADKNVYCGDTKDLIDSLFRAPQLGLPQDEPLFDLANVPVSSFKNTEMFRVHRNVIYCDINPENPNKVYVHEDQFSSPQIMFDFAVKDVAMLDSLLCKYAPRMIESFHNADRRRIRKAFSAQRGTELMAKVKKQFGFHMIFSDEFAMANPNNPTEDFAWVRKEAKDFGIGVLIQTYPYTDKKQFDETTILDNLDTMMRHHVQGPADTSYMGIERRVNTQGYQLAPIYSKQVDFNGRYCIETRGCWRLFGDFMGGPFVSYTLLSPDQTQVISLTGYVYSPRQSKRDLLMQVEGICWTLNFEQ